MSATDTIVAVDLVIVGIYFVTVLVIGFWVAARTKTGEDLFLAGRSLTWWTIGFSLFASNISSTTLIGLSGAAYTSGISVSNYEWMATVVLVFFSIFFIPVYIRSRISTVPEFLEHRFDRRSRNYFSGLTILTNIVVDTAGSLYAGAMVLSLFFPQLDLYTTCIALALVAGLYTAAGGLAAVVYTDVIQAVVLLVGSSLMAWMLFGRVDYSWAQVQASTPPEMLSVIRPLDDPHLPWLGTLIGVPVLGFYFWCTNQFIVQRVLGARGVNHARWGSLLGGLLKLPVLFIMVLPGTMARQVFPGLPRGDLVFPTMITRLLPGGARGLVLAGLIAAIMSSIDSTLNSASTLVTLDFIKPRRPDMTPKEVARVGRIAIVAFMIFSSLWAPQIAHFEGLFNYLQAVLSYIVPPVAALFIVGLFWTRGTANAGFYTMLGGHALSIAVFAGQKLGALPDVHFTIVAGMLFLVSCGLFVAISLLSPPPPMDQVAAFVDRRVETEPVPWWADYRGHSALILLLTAALVIAFW
jgi:SSS family solute:Na+ symporter